MSKSAIYQISFILYTCNSGGSRAGHFNETFLCLMTHSGSYEKSARSGIQSVSRDPGSSLFSIFSLVVYNFLTKFFWDHFFIFP